jgi:hypothetical protein
MKDSNDGQLQTGGYEKLAENPVVPEKLRAQALGFAEECNLLLPDLGKGDRRLHFEAGSLLIQITRFLPNIPEALDEESVPE